MAPSGWSSAVCIMNSGSCHCGKVVFEVRDSLPDTNYCYCETCRKLSGGAFSVVARIPSSEFKVLTGEEQLLIYESSPGKRRYYCGNCCSPIFVTVESQPEFVRIRLGVLDFEPEFNVVGHIWVSEKPKWHRISDGMPQHEEWQDSGQEWPENLP